MSSTIDYFFTLASPWAYLGHAAFIATAERHGARIQYRPMPVRAVFDETGGLPLPKRHPSRQRYRLVELQRWRELRGLPLVLQPKHVPFDPALADRFVLAMLSAGHDPDPFLRRAFHAIWSEERDLADPAVIADLAKAETLPAESLQAAAGSEAIARLYEANRDAAIAAGVFGAPSYLRDGELFWGQDRVELLDKALASGRKPYLPAG